MTRTHHRTLLALLFLLWPALLPAREIFVAPPPAGDDGSGSGAIEAPYATLAHALGQAASGDVITLREGEYAGGVTVGTPNLTLRSHPDEWAVIRAATDVAGIGSALWINTTGARLERLELIGGYYYALKFEQGNATVRACRIHGSGQDAVKIVPGADDITLEASEIYDSGVRDPSNAEGIDNVNGDRMVVRDSYIHDAATNCAYAKGGAIGVVFERCLFARCGHAGVMLGQSSGTEYLDPVQNPTYKESIDGVVRNCVVMETAGAGIALQAALRPQVYNNTLVDVARSGNGGFFVASTSHLGATRASEDIALVNNIVVLGSSSARPSVFITAEGLSGSLTMDHNRYHKVGGSPVFWDERAGAYGWNLASWQSGTGQDSHSSTGDPGLDAAAHLASASSACVGTGQTLASVVDDYDGNPRSAPYDIGADQRGAGPSLAVPPPAGTLGTGRDGTSAASDAGSTDSAVTVVDAGSAMDHAAGDGAPGVDGGPAADSSLGLDAADPIEAGDNPSDAGGADRGGTPAQVAEGCSCASQQRLDGALVGWLLLTVYRRRRSSPSAATSAR